MIGKRKCKKITLASIKLPKQETEDIRQLKEELSFIKSSFDNEIQKIKLDHGVVLQKSK